ncbi:MAG: M28 family peptidase [Bacteroidales bacterium]|nr:M28 family peptidase [Bacteroidales bacterium]
MKRYLYISCLVLISFISCAQSQDINHELINKPDLKNYIEILASDSLQGRFTGSEGQKKAAKFITNRFNQLNLNTPVSGSFSETFILNQRYWNEIYIKKDGQIFTNNDKITYLGNSDQNTEYKTKLVFGGYGTDEDLNQIDINGNMVLVFSKNIRASYNIGSKLSSLGAYGVIIANADNDKQFSSIKRSLGNYILRKRMRLSNGDENTFNKKFQEFAISNDLIKTLTGKSKSNLLKLIDKKSLADCPISKISVKTEKINNTIETENIIGIIPGSSDKSILISAHYDHLEANGDIYYPGADDNASGTAALLELAEVFSKIKNLKYNIIFLATSAEELGLLGSEYHVNSENFDASKILINLNIDMIGRYDAKHEPTDNFIYAIGAAQYPEYIPYLELADSLYQNCEIDYSLGKSSGIPTLYRQSDQFSFHKKGIPAIFFFSGLHNDYHTPRDVANKINFDILTNRVKLISYLIEVIQKYDKVP